jgi:hypothetical protein
VWVLLLAVVFLGSVALFQIGLLRRSWVRTAAALGRAVPHPGPVRDDATELAATLGSAGFVADRWLWLDEVRWGCLALQRADGTRAVVLSGDRPPGFDVVSEVVGGAALLSEHTAFGPNPPGVVRQAMAGATVLELIAAHDAVLAAAGNPRLTVHPAGDVTLAALDFERRSLEHILEHGWRRAASTAWRNLLRRPHDTAPVTERPSDLARLRPAAPR